MGEVRELVGEPTYTYRRRTPELYEQWVYSIPSDERPLLPEQSQLDGLCHMDVAPYLQVRFDSTEAGALTSEWLVTEAYLHPGDCQIVY